VVATKVVANFVRKNIGSPQTLVAGNREHVSATAPKIP
jgi:hypothetical protein